MKLYVYKPLANLRGSVAGMVGDGEEPDFRTDDCVCFHGPEAELLAEAEKQVAKLENKTPTAGSLYRLVAARNVIKFLTTKKEDTDENPGNEHEQ